jgi:hypothetical protein
MIYNRSGTTHLAEKARPPYFAHPLSSIQFLSALAAQAQRHTHRQGSTRDITFFSLPPLLLLLLLLLLPPPHLFPSFCLSAAMHAACFSLGSTHELQLAICHTRHATPHQCRHPHYGTICLIALPLHRSTH